MELSELTTYASEKYQMQEQRKWADFPGFSVLCHPQTGKWIALLMRQWDTETGTEIQRCDLKCGREGLSDLRRPYLSLPVRMCGIKWVGVSFDERTEPQVVFRLLDRAVAFEKPHGVTLVLESRQSEGIKGYQETSLPFSGSNYRTVKDQIPEKLREMRRLFEYGRNSSESKIRSFYRQAVFMQDYEEDCSWTVSDFLRYFPTYQDLTTRQLRGYFSWRTHLRKGEYQPIATSAAYIYIYELLNGIGADSPLEALKKLKKFKTGYLDSGIGDERMYTNLRRWMLEYAVLNDLPQPLAGEYADTAMLEWDTSVSVLKSPENYTDKEVFSALCRLGGKKTEGSPVLENNQERGMRLFCEAWKAASAYCRQEKNLFTLCFGKRQLRHWYPLLNAVYYNRSKQEDRDYVLNDCRSYHCRNGIWQVRAYEKLSFDKGLLQGFLHETDARLRRYLKTGRYLKEKPLDEWAVPYIDAVIENDRKAVLEASRPKITIDLSGLDKIRLDAAGTRDSLLTKEEIGEDTENAVHLTDAKNREGAGFLLKDEKTETAEGAAADEHMETVEGAAADGIPLDHLQIQILDILIKGSDVSALIRENHLMPSVVADAVNEALFDEIGDTVLLCEEDKLVLADDYIEDLTQILGGTGDGRT